MNKVQANFEKSTGSVISRTFNSLNDFTSFVKNNKDLTVIKNTIYCDSIEDQKKVTNIH